MNEKKNLRDQRYERRIVAKVLKKFKVLLKEKALFLYSLLNKSHDIIYNLYFLDFYFYKFIYIFIVDINVTNLINKITHFKYRFHKCEYELGYWLMSIKV